MQGAYVASRVTYMRKLRVTSPIETEFNPSLLDTEEIRGSQGYQGYERGVRS